MTLVFHARHTSWIYESNEHERAMHMNDLRIIGIGSPFAEDNIAELVIQKIKELQSHHPQLKNVTIEYYDRPHLQIMQLIKDAKKAIFIDALLIDDASDIGVDRNFAVGNTVGKVHQFTATDILNHNSQGNMITLNSSHAMGLAFLFAVGRELG